MSKKKKSTAATRQTPPPITRDVLPRRWLTVLSVLLPVLAVVAGAIYWISQKATLGEIGLPFDDSWIPMTFAKNILEHGAYSYHLKDMVTSGAMAPLQVLLLALLGLPLGVDVAASFVLGIAAFAVASYALFRLALHVLDEDQRLAAVVGLLFVVSPLSASAAVSGLPTMLFTATILLSAMFYVTRKPVWFFVFAGLAVWVRPEGLIFILAALVHLLYNHAFARKPETTQPDAQPASRRDTMIGAVVCAVLLVGYAVFNLVLSGSIFPNTVAAKLKYYSAASSDYWGDVLRFYSTSAHAALVVFAGIAVLTLVWNLIRLRRQPLLMSVVYLAGTIIAGGLIFPFVLSMHTLFATLPFFLLLGVWGIRSLWLFLTGLIPGPSIKIIATAVAGIAITAAFVLSVVDWDGMRVVHIRTVRSQLERSVAAANWIAGNSTPATRIATHFPGAMGFYTNCYIVDMTGVVSPHVIPKIGSIPDLVALLKDEKAEMIATQRDHFEVVNVSPFWASDRNAPPLMEIHPFLPGKTRLMSQKASSLNIEAAGLMQANRFDEAYRILEESAKADPLSSRTNTLLGLVLLELKDTTRAEEYLRQALALDPEYSPAMVPLGDILAARKDFLNALPLLEEAHLLNPSSPRARTSWRNALRTQREDSLRGKNIHTFTITR